VRPYSKEESGGLLEPWLGTGLRSTICRAAHHRGADCVRRSPILRNCAMRLPSKCRRQPRRPSRLRRAHARHGGRRRVGGIAVLVLVLVAPVSRSRSRPAAPWPQSPVIEVLHFIGARNSFIAGHFQRHFLRLGLKGGASAAAGRSRCSRSPRCRAAGHAVAAATSIAALFGSLSIGVLGYICGAAQVVLIAAVTAATSRRTVNRTIETIRNFAATHAAEF
jgi:cell division transport system permease protein